MPSAYNTLLEHAAQTGWNENSMLHLACNYINNQDDPEAFMDYITQQCQTEMDGGLGEEDDGTP